MLVLCRKGGLTSIQAHDITINISPLFLRRRKNKSFRPGTRPKKGLKNLQTVKTLTAGQNLCNPSTVKTRKQPLTVTAQFQNSLAALMDTLNQANPFFIRCIKSNPDKIPNKFDEATVIRQVSKALPQRTIHSPSSRLSILAFRFRCRCFHCGNETGTQRPISCQCIRVFSIAAPAERALIEMVVFGSRRRQAERIPHPQWSLVRRKRNENEPAACSWLAGSGV